MSILCLPVNVRQFQDNFTLHGSAGTMTRRGMIIIPNFMNNGNSGIMKSILISFSCAENN